MGLCLRDLKRHNETKSCQVIQGSKKNENPKYRPPSHSGGPEVGCLSQHFHIASHAFALSISPQPPAPTLARACQLPNFPYALALLPPHSLLVPLPNVRPPCLPAPAAPALHRRARPHPAFAPAPPRVHIAASRALPCPAVPPPPAPTSRTSRPASTAQPVRTPARRLRRRKATCIPYASINPARSAFPSPPHRLPTRPRVDTPMRPLQLPPVCVTLPRHRATLASSALLYRVCAAPHRHVLRTSTSAPMPPPRFAGGPPCPTPILDGDSAAATHPVPRCRCVSSGTVPTPSALRAAAPPSPPSPHPLAAPSHNVAASPVPRASTMYGVPRLPYPVHGVSLPHATARRTCIYRTPLSHRAILLQAAIPDRHAHHISVIAPAVQTASPLCPVVVAPSPAPPGPSWCTLHFKFPPPYFTIWYPRHTYLSHHARNFPFMLFDTPNNIPLVLHSRETPIVARVTTFSTIVTLIL
ncbi:hypothetical protein B0H14DRAFT_3768466 [Mycena olivaceomarginata]|nr:hypothetical protein B0H14DRAFT_3768466 [Mycena olivaceomarginata]